MRAPGVGRDPTAVDEVQGERSPRRLDDRGAVRVEVLDEFQDIVQRVTVYTSGQRDDEEIELRQDSADPGSWAIELESQGTSDETRTDRFELRLYEPDGTFSGEVETTEE